MSSIKKICLWTCYSFTSFFLSVISAGANASNILIDSSVSSDAKVISSDSIDMLVPSLANTVGNSYTKLTSFVIDRPLKLINTADVHGSIQGATAKLIILDIGSADLRSNIEIVGETADLLVISSSGQTCTGCSFTNIGRATLATATASYSDTSYSPSSLVPTSSALTVNGLSTDRVASIEFIGKNITLKGSINTQARGSQLPDGTYQFNPTGGLIIGAGGVNVFSGFTVDYPTLGLGLRQTNAVLSIGGDASITSQAVHISTASPFVLGGTINTRSDVATAVNYRGNLSAVEEAIKIYSLADTGMLIVGGALYSDNLVDVRSSSDLVFNGYIQAAGLLAVAGSNSKLTQVASGTMNLIGNAARWVVSKSGNQDVVANATCPNDQPSDTNQARVCVSAFFSAGRIDNNGTIKGRNVVMAAINELQNRYGGKILADNIQLSSQTSFVRNGSKYPFKPADDQPLIFAPIDPNNIPLGTITIDGAPFLAAETGATKVDTTALVLGKNITIVASGNVENINPYLAYTLDSNEWINGVSFSPAKSAQVQIIADNNLKIGSSTYLLNASAYLGVANSGGSLFVNSPAIANQRYSTEAVVQPYSRTVNGITNSGTEAALMVYSPPGVIYSFAPLTFNMGVTGSFVNNTSYFEVLNDATFSNLDASRLINIGLNTQSVVATSVNDNYVACISKVDTSGYGEEVGRRVRAEYDKCAALYGGTTVAPGTVVEAQQGTLFSVKGKVNGDNADLFVTNHNVMSEMKNQVISDYILAHSGANATSGSDSITVSGTGGGTVKYNYLSSASLSNDGAYILYDRYVTARDATSCGGSYGCYYAAPVGSKVSGSYETVTDVLTRKYLEVKNFLIEAIKKLMALLS